MNDKMYGIKVNSERLKLAKDYCKEKNISLTSEIRQTIDKFYIKGLQKEKENGS